MCHLISWNFFIKKELLHVGKIEKNMRKLLIACMVVGTMAFTFTGCGGNDRKMSTSAAVPNDVLEEFNDMYPTADDVKWRTNDGLYEAEFEVGKKNMKATYTPDGDLVEIDG